MIPENKKKFFQDLETFIKGYNYQDRKNNGDRYLGSGDYFDVLIEMAFLCVATNTQPSVALKECIDIFYKMCSPTNNKLVFKSVDKDKLMKPLNTIGVPNKSNSPN